MNKKFVKVVLFIPSIVLTIETITYNLLYCIIPVIINKLGIFEYSMAITNYDFNKAWIGFICFSLFLAYIRLNKSSKAVYELIYICSYIFIGLNLIISTIIFSYFRFFGVGITDFLSIQKYFGVFIFTLYGLCFTFIPIILVKSNLQNISMNKSNAEAK